MGKKGRTQAGRQTGVTGSVIRESGGGPCSHGHRLRCSLSLSTGVCSVESSESLLSTGQETSVSSLEGRLSCNEHKTKTIILSAPDARTTRLGPGGPGSSVRELLCSSHPVSTKAMIHRFPVETETLQQSLNEESSPRLSCKEERAPRTSAKLSFQAGERWLTHRSTCVSERTPVWEDHGIWLCFP